MVELRTFLEKHLMLRKEMGCAWNPLKDDDGNDINFIFTNSDGYPSKPAAINTA